MQLGLLVEAWNLLESIHSKKKKWKDWTYLQQELLPIFFSFIRTSHLSFLFFCRSYFPFLWQLKQREKETLFSISSFVMMRITVQSLYSTSRYNIDVGYNTVMLWLLDSFTNGFYKVIIRKMTILVIFL